MNAEFLRTQLTAYLGLRQALGYQMTAEKRLLPAFVAFVESQHLTGPIRAQVALDWACEESVYRGPDGNARRLSIARQFLVYLQASVPETEVPDYALLPTTRRSKPYIFTPAQLTDLFEAALASRPQRSLRPYTLSTLIGLLASTGLRAGEALRLQVTDVKLALDPPQLHILQTKFRKSRIVPLHSSTAERLQFYAEQRGHDGTTMGYQIRFSSLNRAEHWPITQCTVGFRVCANAWACDRPTVAVVDGLSDTA